MSYLPDINDLEAALKHLHDPEALRTNPLSTLDLVHQRIAAEQRVVGDRSLPLPWIYGSELSILLRSLIDGLDDRDEVLGGEGRRAATRPRLYARILKLRYGQGLSWGEVADQIGRVAGHIQNKLKRPALQMLLGELLRAPAAVELVSAPEGPVSVSNLPPQGEFIGRQVELEQLLTRLRWRRLPLVEVCGSGGVGKSELARRAAWLALEHERLFDAVVWLSAQESYLSLTRLQPVRLPGLVRTLADIFDVMAQVLGIDVRALELAERQRQVLLALADGRFPRGVLLLLDNYESIAADEQRKIAEFLFSQLPYPHQALITSRHEEHQVRVFTHMLPFQLRLGPMSHEETHACLRHFLTLQQPPLALSAAAIDKIAAAADGVPLALLWLLGQVRYSLHTLPQLLEALRGPQVPTSPLLHYIFDHSFALLAEQAAAQQLLYALACFPQGASVAALAYVADLSEAGATQGLALLAQLSLVTHDLPAEPAAAPVRYLGHTLAHGYLRGKLEPAAWRALMMRACAYYGSYVEPGAHQLLVGLLEWAMAQGLHRNVIELFDMLTEGNQLGSHTQVRYCDAYGVAVVRACQQLGLEQQADWYALYAVCWPQVVRRHIAEAQLQLERLLARAQQRGWLMNEALACSTLGLLYYDCADVDDDEDDQQLWAAPYAQATRYLEAAATIWERLARADWLAVVLGRLAAIRCSTGDWIGAANYYLRAAVLYAASGNLAAHTLTLRRRAHTLLQQYRHQREGDPQEIVALLQQAFAAYDQIGDRRGRAMTSLCYAELLQLLGERRRATEQIEAARADYAAVHDAYGMQRASALALQLRSDAGTL